MPMLCETHHREMRQIGQSLVCADCLGAASAPAVAQLQAASVRAQSLQYDRRLREAGIPQNFQACTFATWGAQNERSQRLCKLLKKYADDFAKQRHLRNGFIFTGPPGTGKTHMACALVHALVDGGFTARYLSLPTFTRAIKATYGRSGHTDALLRSVIDCDFLVVDEIDLHGSSDADYNILYDIINSRYERAGAPVLAISNRPVERLIVDLDGRIVSRILGAQSAIAFDWASQREVRMSQRRFGMEGPVA